MRELGLDLDPERFPRQEFMDKEAAAIMDVVKRENAIRPADHVHPNGPGKDKQNPRTYLNDATKMLENYRKVKESKGEDPDIIEWR